MDPIPYLMLHTGLKILFILAVAVGAFAPALVWAERRQSAMIQDRIGPRRAGIQLPEWVVEVNEWGFKAVMLAMAAVGLAFVWSLVGDVHALMTETETALFFTDSTVHAFMGLVVLGAAAAPPYYLWKTGGQLRLLGLLHPLADALKMIMKEDFVPPKADKLLHAIAPVISLIPAIAAFTVIPFGDIVYPEHFLETLPRDGQIMPLAGAAAGWAYAPFQMQIASLDIGILFIFAIAGTGVIGAAVGGYASDNKYSLIGGIRAAGQMVSYEVALGLTIVPMFMLYDSLRLEVMGTWQAEHYWGVFHPLGFIAFIFFVTASIAESKRIPFDLPEGESELVGGYLTEYSGMKFGMFFMSEFIEVVVLAALATTIFLGGWDLPMLYRDGFHTPLFDIPLVHGAVVGLHVLTFILKVIALMWLQLQIRWTLPRFRYDQVMSLCWKGLLPLALVNILLMGVVILAGS